jgi:hypothetical protein
MLTHRIAILLAAGLFCCLRVEQASAMEIGPIHVGLITKQAESDGFTAITKQILPQYKDLNLFAEKHTLDERIVLYWLLAHYKVKQIISSVESILIPEKIVELLKPLFALITDTLSLTFNEHLKSGTSIPISKQIAENNRKLKAAMSEGNYKGLRRFLASSITLQNAHINPPGEKELKKNPFALIEDLANSVATQLVTKEMFGGVFTGLMDDTLPKTKLPELAEALFPEDELQVALKDTEFVKFLNSQGFKIPVPEGKKEESMVKIPDLTDELGLCTGIQEKSTFFKKWLAKTPLKNVVADPEDISPQNILTNFAEQLKREFKKNKTKLLNKKELDALAVICSKLTISSKASDPNPSVEELKELYAGDSKDESKKEAGECKKALGDFSDSLKSLANKLK